jgi:hypothetical protein
LHDTKKPCLYNNRQGSNLDFIGTPATPLNPIVGHGERVHHQDPAVGAMVVYQAGEIGPSEVDWRCGAIMIWSRR